jgi:dolichol-phosphate mannosyltransferase
MNRCEPAGPCLAEPSERPRADVPPEYVDLRKREDLRGSERLRAAYRPAVRTAVGDRAHRRRAWPALVVAALAAFVLFMGMDRPLADTDEGRQAEIPRQMLARGDYLVPHFGGLPYCEKPPLQYWLTAAAYWAFGIHTWVARLVPALAAWLTVLITFAWGRRALGDRPAFLGAIVLCLFPGFVALGRTVVLDSLLAACVVGSWYAAARAVRRTRLRWRWWLASALICGLGVLTKGPVALVLLIPPVVAYQVWAPSTARPRVVPWIVYLSIVAMVAGPWYVKIAMTEPSFASRFLWRANVVRFLTPFDHEQPWWFYAPVLAVSTFPWSLLWPWLAYLLWRRSPQVGPRTPAAGFLAAAVAWCLLFFSLSGCKSPPYLAPALPPLALLTGACLTSFLRRPRVVDRFLDFSHVTLPRATTYIALWASVGCYVASAVLGWQSWGWAAAAVIVTMSAGFVWWRPSRAARPALAWAACVLATLGLVAVAAPQIGAGFASRHSLKWAVRAARRLPDAANLPIVSYRRTWLSASFYLRRDTVLSIEEDARPALFTLLRRLKAAMILVEKGPPLDELLGTLPNDLDASVTLPEREGQAALVVVRQRPLQPPPLLRGRLPA